MHPYPHACALLPVSTTTRAATDRQSPPPPRSVRSSRDHSARCPEPDNARRLPHPPIYPLP
eukprot:5835864-Prymnesium_polylepis.2